MASVFTRLRRRFGLLLAASLLLIGAAAQAQTYAQTRYPIVLVHGIFGFDSFLGVDYFYGVPGALRSDGARVFVSQVSAANSNEVRGEQLLAEVKNILAITGAAKVNLVGHSQGSPTIRYVAGVAPHLVASATSIGGVNKGSRIADIVRGVAPAGSISESLANSITNAFVALINLGSGGTSLPQLPTAALDSLTTAGLAKFNQRFPQALPSGCGSGAELVNGVRYFSWAGTMPVTNLLDVADGPIGILSLAFGEPNDGLVAACATRLGTHLGDYRQNHLDEVNQVVGLVDWWSVNPVTLYRQHANRLKLLGL
jgi:triacylglycerol lipase